jgi:hypothetical protein
MDAHVGGCAACRAARLQLDQLRAHLADQAVWEEPAPALADRVLDTIRAGTAAEAAPLAGRSRARPRARWLAGAAAAVLLVFGVLAFAARSTPSAPDWQLALRATPEAPGAVADVEGWNGPTGMRVELHVEGLEPSGDDRYYAIWFTSPDGRHVPAGTFRDSGDVVAWAGVTRDEFPRVWVTLEPDDGDEALSGPTVLDTPGY